MSTFALENVPSCLGWRICVSTTLHVDAVMELGMDCGNRAGEMSIVELVLDRGGTVAAISPRTSLHAAGAHNAP